MEKLQLNEQEIDVFFDIFDKFDVLRCGKLPTETVRRILSHSGLSDNDVNEVLNLSGAPNTGYFGRSHFFTALKFVALAQNGLPVSLESLSEHACRLPLPILNITEDDYGILFENLEDTKDKSPLGSNGAEEVEEAPNSPNQTNIRFDTENQSDDVVPGDEQSRSVTLDKEQSAWVSKDEDEERGLLSGVQSKKSSEILASFNIEKSAKSQKTKGFKSGTRKFKDDFLSGEQSLIVRSSSASQVSSSSSQSLSSSDSESSDPNRAESKVSNSDSSWVYQGLNDGDSKVPPASGPSEPSKPISPSLGSDANPRKENLGSFYPKPYLSNGSESPQFSSDQKSHKNERRRRWITSFALNPKREADYLVQFNELFISTNSTKTLVSPSEVTQLFGAQFNLSTADFEQIWNMADLDHDGFLDSTEFCLASHLARLHAYEGLSLEDAIEASSSFVSRLGFPTKSRVFNGSPQMSPDSAEYPLMYMNRRDQELSSENEQTDVQDTFTGHCSRSGSGQYQLIGTELQDSSDHHIDQDSNRISQDISIDPDDSDSPVESVDDHGDAALLPKRKSSAQLLSCKDVPRSPSERDKYTHINRDSERSNSRSSSSCSFYDSSDPTDSPYASDSTSDSDQNTDDPVSSNSRNFGIQHRINRPVDPIHLLSVTTGRKSSALSSLSSVQRRRLLCSLIREAKSLNHTLLRLNNEMQGELKELNDQRVNLSVQLQHLGLQPSTSSF